jgi:hypothetical protein
LRGILHYTTLRKAGIQQKAEWEGRNGAVANIPMLAGQWNKQKPTLTKMGNGVGCEAEPKKTE